MTTFNKINTTLFIIFFLPLSLLAEEKVSHSIWNELTMKHVSENGNVNYKGFIEEEKKLDSYLATLGNHHPDDKWSKNEKLAFWINAYNAFTVKLVIINYPVKSIKEIGGSLYKVNTAWDVKFINIGEEVYDLNNIEHGIIRKEFSEPRIHFAVNCASISCPNLRNEAFTADKLEKQLDEQAKNFINDKEKNTVKNGKSELSKIFLWFKGDFKNGDSDVISFINKYSEEKINSKTKISYKSYNWNLNE